MAGYLIKDTTREERERIVEESLGAMEAACDGCAAGLAEYPDYLRDTVSVETHDRSARMPA